MEGQIRQIRQGDVLLVPVEGVTPPASARHTRSVVLAEGETTGHQHLLVAERIAEWEEDGHRYVSVLSDRMGAISHPDHDPIPAVVVLPRVTYEVIPQRVHNLEGQWRKVRD